MYVLSVPLFSLHYFYKDILNKARKRAYAYSMTRCFSCVFDDFSKFATDSACLLEIERIYLE